MSVIVTQISKSKHMAILILIVLKYCLSRVTIMVYIFFSFKQSTWKKYY